MNKSVITCCLALVLCLALSGCASKRVYPAREAAGRVTLSVAQRVVETARGQVGTPYRMGGASPQKGFDCSGLIFWAYGQHGVHVPRQTVQQARIGNGVARNRLQPGDILVFRNSGAPNGLHTGIYAGRNQFIHSPNSRSVVRLESLTPYWIGHYVTGRRVTRSVSGR